MKGILLAGLIILAAGCRKNEPPKEDLVPTKAVVAGERLIDFDERNGAFACRAPADWKALEDQGGGGSMVMFFGPRSGPDKGKVSMSVSRYPDGVDLIKTPQDYWRMLQITGRKPSALASIQVGARMGYCVHHEEPQHPPAGWKALYMNREDTVIIPHQDGFFTISHTAPADTYRKTLPVFKAVVESFQPKRRP